ncbi:hypothetical protein SISNIDRAFT_464049 [Sistotremastrum niveocremeum HHB9708]|uniref:Uncharacterized protein n=1 Tax=Sistotremastrum niveocremeum HHB9708 TaxID=1314777 RepID=A0A164Y521_9AGAM|nr:hypothetical protein SISNIDRAFT_464049 [Sistotremastrum niveocremeum HHB9708]
MSTEEAGRRKGSVARCVLLSKRATATSGRVNVWNDFSRGGSHLARKMKKEELSDGGASQEGTMMFEEISSRARGRKKSADVEKYVVGYGVGSHRIGRLITIGVSNLSGGVSEKSMKTLGMAGWREGKLTPKQGFAGVKGAQDSEVRSGARCRRRQTLIAMTLPESLDDPDTVSRPSFNTFQWGDADQWGGSPEVPINCRPKTIRERLDDTPPTRDDRLVLAQRIGTRLSEYFSPIFADVGGLLRMMDRVPLVFTGVALKTFLQWRRFDNPAPNEKDRHRLDFFAPSSTFDAVHGELTSARQGWHAREEHSWLTEEMRATDEFPFVRVGTGRCTRVRFFERSVQGVLLTIVLGDVLVLESDLPMAKLYRCCHRRVLRVVYPLGGKMILPRREIMRHELHADDDTVELYDHARDALVDMEVVFAEGTIDINDYLL